MTMSWLCFDGDIIQSVVCYYFSSISHEKYCSNSKRKVIYPVHHFEVDLWNEAVLTLSHLSNAQFGQMGQK